MRFFRPEIAPPRLCFYFPEGMTRQDKWNEHELIGRLRSSDRKAFHLLFEEYQPTLFRFILYHARDRELSHDIVQETFLRVWDTRASLRPELSFLAYLFRISRNLFRDRLRKLAAKKRFEEEIAPAMLITADDPNDLLHPHFRRNNSLTSSDRDCRPNVAPFSYSAAWSCSPTTKSRSVCISARKRLKTRSRAL